jgi:hypothetical protein
VSLRAWIDKLTRRPHTVEEQPAIQDPYNPPLPVLTPEEQAAKTEEQRKLLDEHDKEVGRGNADPPDYSVTP